MADFVTFHLFSLRPTQFWLFSLDFSPFLPPEKILNIIGDEYRSVFFGFPIFCHFCLHFCHFWGGDLMVFGSASESLKGLKGSLGGLGGEVLL